MKFIEETGDLFDIPLPYAYVHCISADAAMGAGIAKTFVQKYPELRSYVRSTKPKIGDVVMYNAPDGRAIFNLVTKDRYYQKPTYKTMETALRSLRQVTEEQNIRYLAMPRIGCGLDRLDWKRVRAMIQDTFRDLDINIIIRHL